MMAYLAHAMEIANSMGELTGECGGGGHFCDYDSRWLAQLANGALCWIPIRWFVSSFGQCAAACLFDDAKANRARLWAGAAIAITYLLLIVAGGPELSIRRLPMFSIARRADF
jgi:hypothetical protein